MPKIGKRARGVFNRAPAMFKGFGLERGDIASEMVMEIVENPLIIGRKIEGKNSIGFVKDVENYISKAKFVVTFSGISTISEAIFNKKLWELATIYRGINFKDNVQKIDFTIGFISLEFFEEKETIERDQ